ncbi:ComEC/Rec2 family competence protein [Candidatus Roizmanbacteria bacterium]|nr:MAG: ComEC/Rec2 family competence protein [Candidatus Roizmanbacteria bacterium]
METITDLFNSYLPEPHASLMNGILLGRPLFVTDTFYNQLKAVGLIHIVVLSGMNITLLSSIILRIMVPFIGRKLAMMLTIGIIVGFIFFVGPEAPVVRAGIMGILSLVGLLFGRKALTIYSLFLSALAMILINPSWLTSISFQLSFAATLGIILFGSPVRNGDKTQDELVKANSVVSYLLEELRISLSAQVFTVPIIFYYFRQVSLVAPIANILIAWLIAPIMILGLIIIPIGLISWQFGFVASWSVYPLLSIIVFVTEGLSKIPYASFTL